MRVWRLAGVGRPKMRVWPYTRSEAHSHGGMGDRLIPAVLKTGFPFVCSFIINNLASCHGGIFGRQTAVRHSNMQPDMQLDPYSEFAAIPIGKPAHFIRLKTPAGAER